MLLNSLEDACSGTSVAVAEVLDDLTFNQDGLIPAIAQQYDSKEVLMMAWMNRASIEESLTTRRVCYFSRSRQMLWRKGEESGHIQHLVDMRFDCDGDTLLLLVDQTGPACHTRRENCFYFQVSKDVHVQNMQVTVMQDRPNSREQPPTRKPE